jgi:hypothetical protein
MIIQINQITYVFAQANHSEFFSKIIYSEDL